MSATPMLKWERIVRHLLDGNTLTRFKAEDLGDHALNSTVSRLGTMGFTVSRRPITLEGRFGQIRCCEYWIALEDRDRARQLLGAL